MHARLKRVYRRLKQSLYWFTAAKWKPLIMPWEGEAQAKTSLTMKYQAWPSSCGHPRHQWPTPCIPHIQPRPACPVEWEGPRWQASEESVCIYTDELHNLRPTTNRWQRLRAKINTPQRSIIQHTESLAHIQKRNMHKQTPANRLNAVLDADL